jgi:pimeloyl-ACP methyl ester carboxylesterase
MNRMVAVAALMVALNSGHWIMEENPQATVKLVADFLAK